MGRRHKEEERMIRNRIVFVFFLVCGLVTLGSVSAQQEGKISYRLDQR